MSKLFVHDGVDFTSEEVNRIFYHDGVDFSKEVNRVWAHDGTEWMEIFPGDQVEPLPPGQYILSPVSQDLTGTSGFSDYVTTAFRGRITEIRARCSWVPQIICVQGINNGVSGRPNGNFYRNIVNDGSFCGRTIDHRIDSFDASSLTDFNSGAATGFSYNTIGALENTWSTVRLNLTIA